MSSNDPLSIHINEIGNIDYNDIILDMPIELSNQEIDFEYSIDKKHYFNFKKIK
jgi:hypothetical protein